MGRTVESLMADARSFLRDFPRFFTASSPLPTTVGRNIDLPYKNIFPAGLVVWASDGTTTVDGERVTANNAATASTFRYNLDERNGLIRVADPPTGGFADNSYVNVEGYFFEWVADQDLWFHINNIVAEHSFRRVEWSFAALSDQEADAIALGGAYEAMMALWVEYSRDIDVNTPEAMAIPVSQRFRQVQQLLFGPEGLAARYKTKAQMLGVGLERVEVGTLRRVSRTTNRLVPVYQVREYDDIGRPKRVFTRPDVVGDKSPPEEFIPGRFLMDPSAPDTGDTEV